MTVDSGLVIELEVSKVVHGGAGLGRYAGFVVFVAGGLPGERVIARIYSVKKSHAFADILDVVVPSPYRQAHIWPEADIARPPETRAGGANFGHIDLDYQRELKTAVLRDSLIRQGHMNPASVAGCVVSGVPGDGGLGWRTRVTLHVDDTGQAGPFAERSHRVIPVSSLPLAVSGLEALHAHRQTWPGHQSVRLVASSGGQTRVIVDNQAPQEIREDVSGDQFVLSDHSFWQVHRQAANELSKSVEEIIRTRASAGELYEDGSHLDLYAGVGLFARAIGRAFGESAEIIAVESDPNARKYSEANLASLVNAQAITSDVPDFLRHYAPQGRLGVVVLDPPRSGAKAAVVGHLLRLRPQLVVYVACDPVALARDTHLLVEGGYDVREVVGLDLFPYTHHFEALAVFLPASSQ